jgi:hypothetical protein
VVLAGGLPTFFYTLLQTHALSSAEAKDLKALFSLGFLIVIGVWACGYGVAVLRGREGKMQILGKILTAQSDIKSAQQE